MQREKYAWAQSAGNVFQKLISIGVGVKLQLTFYDYFCAVSTFRINGIEADHCEFGAQYDHDLDNPQEPGACGDMRFDVTPPTDYTLAKYGISPDEYQLIANKLAEGLSFGDCGLCV